MASADADFLYLPKGGVRIDKLTLFPMVICALGICLLTGVLVRVTKRDGYSIVIKGLGVSIEIKHKRTNDVAINGTRDSGR